MEEGETSLVLTIEEQSTWFAQGKFEKREWRFSFEFEFAIGKDFLPSSQLPVNLHTQETEETWDKNQ